MANDKDFILKNAVEVGGPTKVTLGTVTSDNIDLSTGNYFKDTPTGNSTYSISNAGDVQSFQLEVTGGSEAVAENFSTTLYTGNGGTQTIDNGIDLAGDGGLVWIKGRTFSDPLAHMLWDTERGSLKAIFSNTTDAEYSFSNTLTSFNASGFSIGLGGAVSSSGEDFASWTFKKATKFFDVVTYTGTGSAQTISHDLGTTVGCIIVKNLTTSGINWTVYHRKIDSNPTQPARYFLELNQTGARTFDESAFGVLPTDTVFTVGSDNSTNASGDTYVAYLFAHDTAADSQIKCGSYTGGGNTDVEIDLGWKPSWLLIRRSDATEDWFILDTSRGLGADGDPNAILSPNLSNAESSSSTRVALNSTGFFTTANTGSFNASGGNYIYIAIRAASEPDITWPSSIEWAGGVAPSAPAVGETDVFTITTDDGGTSYVGVKTADNLS